MEADGRKLIVVDLETTGLRDTDIPIEIAAIPPSGAPHYFVPYLAMADLDRVDPDALRINRYFERGVYKNQRDPAQTRKRYVELHEMLTGNTLGGSNPRFDAGMLSRRFVNYCLSPEPWHHRLADLSAYAAGVLSIPATELPGLDTVCELLGVVNREPHSAMGDAQATADCFRLLMER